MRVFVALWTREKNVIKEIPAEIRKNISWEVGRWGHVVICFTLQQQAALQAGGLGVLKKSGKTETLEL